MSKQKRIPYIKGNGSYHFEVVGESHYQPALRRVAGPRSEDGVRAECIAMLCREPNNPHDPNAVRVEVNGATVGYVPRDMAPDVQEALTELWRKHGERIAVNAVIVGGRLGQNYGVWLDLDLEYDDEVDEDEDEKSNAAPLPPIEKHRAWWQFW